MTRFSQSVMAWSSATASTRRRLLFAMERGSAIDNRTVGDPCVCNQYTIHLNEAEPDTWYFLHLARPLRGTLRGQVGDRPGTVPGMSPTCPRYNPTSFDGYTRHPRPERFAGLPRELDPHVPTRRRTSRADLPDAHGRR